MSVSLLSFWLSSFFQVHRLASVIVSDKAFKDNKERAKCFLMLYRNLQNTQLTCDVRFLFFAYCQRLE